MRRKEVEARQTATFQKGMHVHKNTHRRRDTHTSTHTHLREGENKCVSQHKMPLNTAGRV